MIYNQLINHTKHESTVRTEVTCSTRMFPLAPLQLLVPFINNNQIQGA